MQVTAQQARGIMRGIEQELKASFALIPWVKAPRDKKTLTDRISFLAHPVRMELHEIVPGQQYAVVILIVAVPTDRQVRVTDEGVKLATRRVWILGSASTRQKAKGFCPARLQILVDPAHTCGQCHDVERVSQVPQEGEDFTKKTVELFLPAIEGALRQH